MCKNKLSTFYYAYNVLYAYVLLNNNLKVKIINF